MTTMTQQVCFKTENQKRIRAVEKSFWPAGIRLVDPDRVLIGEGRLMKQSRREPQPKAFFLFSDMLLYGSIVINGRWFKRQKVIPLEDIELEDVENSSQMKHQWLVKTPQKSFYVSAASLDEKQAWMEHIKLCKARLLQSSDRTACSTFAVSWIPDPTSTKCMLCSKVFTFTRRRHHCRNCGFLVCGECSKQCAVINHIHPTAEQRVCKNCYSILTKEAPDRKDSGGQRAEEEEHSSDEHDEDHDEDHMEENYDPVYWAASGMDSFAPYVYLKPEHVWPSQ